MATSDPPPGSESAEPGGQADAPDKKWSTWTKAAIAIAPVLALLIATWTAWQGQITVDRSNRATLRQSEDAQLSTAITAIGSNDTAEEIAGLLLLARNTSNRFTLMGQTEEPATEVFGDYTTALQILSGYLKSHSDTLLEGSPQTAAVFGRGYGLPPAPGIPSDLTYAANQVKFLLASNIETIVAALNLGTNPAIDLSNVELIGQPWTGVNFSWISAFMVGVDLRGASLESSQWSKNSNLSGSDLQCADLQHADFQGANLSNADLEGADVQGANFRGANLSGALVGQLYGFAKWSSRPPGITAVSARGWSQAACMQNTIFWRGQPTSVASPISSPMPKPSASSGK